MIPFDLESLTQECECGQKHRIEIKEIVLKQGALEEIPRMIQQYGFVRPLILCDCNTYQAAGKRVQELLPVSKRITLNPEHLHADEHGVGSVQAQMESGECPDLLLAVGSGTIHDIARYLAYHKKLAFFSVPTAASVDGFVSTVAAMTWNGFKKSFTAVSPMCVIADTDIIAHAPMRLSASGAADLLGKYTALADWRISHLLTGEPICERICRMEEDAIEKVKNNSSGLKAGESDAYETLMYGLLLSGLAMQMTGNSRPASGAEHHLSHLWEMELINPPIDAYHGEKVGVGLGIACDRYHWAAKMMKDQTVTIQTSQEKLSDLLSMTENNRIVLQEMIEENTPDPFDAVDPEVFFSKKEEVIALLEALPSGEEIRDLLKKIGAPATMSEIGLSDTIVKACIQLSPYVRRRITFMRLMKMMSCYETEIFRN